MLNTNYYILAIKKVRRNKSELFLRIFGYYVIIPRYNSVALSWSGSNSCNNVGLPLLGLPSESIKPDHSFLPKNKLDISEIILQSTKLLHAASMKQACETLKVSKSGIVRIWKHHNLKVSECECVRIWRYQNLKVSESESVRI